MTATKTPDHDRFAGPVAQTYSHWLNPSLDTWLGPMQTSQATLIAHHYANTYGRDKVLVEIGLGTGKTLDAVDTQILNRGLPEPMYMAFDPSADMCAVARKELAPNLLRRVMIVEKAGVDVQQMCFNVHLLYTAHTLHNLDEGTRTQTIEAMVSTLDPGGIISIVDKMRSRYCTDDLRLHARRIEMIQRFFTSPEINRPDMAEYWVRHEEEDMARAYKDEDLHNQLTGMGLACLLGYRKGPYAHFLFRKN